VSACHEAIVSGALAFHAETFGPRAAVEVVYVDGSVAYARWFDGAYRDKPPGSLRRPTASERRGMEWARPSELTVHFPASKRAPAWLTGEAGSLSCPGRSVRGDVT
jgi:hypothetical protein